MEKIPVLRIYLWWHLIAHGLLGVGSLAIMWCMPGYMLECGRWVARLLTVNEMAAGVYGLFFIAFNKDFADSAYESRELDKLSEGSMGQTIGWMIFLSVFNTCFVCCGACFFITYWVCCAKKD